LDRATVDPAVGFVVDPEAVVGLDDVGVALGGGERQVFDGGDLAFEVDADAGFALDALNSLGASWAGDTGGSGGAGDACGAGGSCGAGDADEA
jgi:hypothetical protein